MNEDKIIAFQTLYSIIGIPFMFIGYDGNIFFSQPSNFKDYFLDDLEKDPPDTLKDSRFPGGLTLVEVGTLTNSVVCKLDDKGYLITAPIRSSRNGFVSVERIRHNIKQSQLHSYLNRLHTLPIISIYQLIAYTSMIKYIYSGMVPEGINYYQSLENSKGHLTTKKDSRDFFIIDDIQMHSHKDVKQRKKINVAIQNGDEDSLKKVLKNPNIDLKNLSSFDPLQHLRNIAILDIYSAVETAIQTGVFSEPIYNQFDLFCAKLDSLQSPSEISELKRNFLFDLCRLVQQQSEISSYNPLTKKAISYINQNIYSKLSVNLISEALFVNRSTLSNVFKKDTNRSLHEYILDGKLEKSKELLKQTDSSVLDISVILNFSSHSHFADLFRRKYNMTPSEFRKK